MSLDAAALLFSTCDKVSSVIGFHILKLSCLKLILTITSLMLLFRNRFIKVMGTYNTVGNTFNLVSMEAMYSTESNDQFEIDPVSTLLSNFLVLFVTKIAFIHW